MKRGRKPRVAIVGAGWAGLAAAVELAHYAHLTLFEAGRQPGGRARCVLLEGMWLDNGQHILLGAYGECLRLIRQIGQDPEALLLRLPLQWYQVDGLQLCCPRLPAPIHLVSGLLLAQGISFRDKWQLACSLEHLKSVGWRLTNDGSVADWLDKQQHSGRLIESFWRPLVLAALNTPLEKASMQTLAHVLRDSIGSSRAASDLLLPRVDLSSLFPLPACRWLASWGNRLYFGHRVSQLQRQPGGWRVDKEEGFDAVIIALAPYHLARLLNDSKFDNSSILTSINSLEYYPIYTVYLKFSQTVGLPYPMVGLRAGTAHWLFDRERIGGEKGLISAVISAVVSSPGTERERLIDGVMTDLLRWCPHLPPPIEARVIAEKRATFASTVGRLRPDVRLGLDGVYLAGDWMAADYPATLEGAVRSGVGAARMLLHDWAKR